MQFADIQSIPLVVNVMKVLVTGFIAFMLAFSLTPLMTYFLYKYRIGIKIKDKSVDGQQLTFVNKLHQDKSGTPTMGGILIWISVLIFILASHYIFPYLALFFEKSFIARLDFFSRKETWLPLFTLVMAGVLGLCDDWMSIRSIGKNKGGGMRFAMRFGWLIAIAIAGAYWFYFKLDWHLIHVPGVGNFDIGWWYIPLFIFVILFTAISSNETDGLDGLNGGILMIAFSAFAIISFVHDKLDLASFCAAIAGAMLAFLWFNIYPARFFMGDTGAVSLGITLGVVAMLNNSAIILFIIVFIYILESASVAIQLTSKKLFKRKVFLAAPIHHHFEAKGWPENKVTMRAWIFTMMTAFLGVIIGLLGMGK